ncbi:4Fe-4S binding protein [Methanolobus halotolerans]|uniref:4Fe-4S ferredoxin n=1 Tax=Methanolobus halotolerans TaxID=2052935 RepID=A0A4E0Q574_9EURY|nr:4Fe-4S binding protein [Methanolobus halotolerans]TGC09195.1 4Fe-4S ferredoxin [Methanolobus halotolerans]
MLKITPYLGILVIIVSVAGLWFPLLGYFLLVVFATLMITSIFRGRWFCGNLCPRGSFNDFWVGKITRNKKIPGFLRSLWIRIPLFAMMMVFMGYRLLSTEGVINQIGMVFVIMCIMTTSIALVAGITVSPRTWCTFCPMGTVQNLIGGSKYQLHMDDSKCVSCKKCDRSCPMQLDVHTNEHKPDCIKCGRCITTCPTNALAFKP